MPPERIFLIVWCIGVLVTWPPWIWLSVHSRRAYGYPVIPCVLPGSIYSERRASGRQRGKLGGASKCLLISVTKDTFLIAPSFPFNMIAPRGLLGLEITVPLAQVVEIAEASRFGANTRLKIAGPSDMTVLELKVRDPAAFIAAVKSRR